MGVSGPSLLIESTDSTIVTVFIVCPTTSHTQCDVVGQTNATMFMNIITNLLLLRLQMDNRDKMDHHYLLSGRQSILDYL